MLLALFLQLLSAHSHPYSTEITKDNVFEIIGKEKHVFLHFFSEGCRHCLKMQPEWNELVRMYHPIKEIVFGAICCDRYRSVCFGLDGTSSPSVQYFAPQQRKGQVLGGNKTTENFLQKVLNYTSIPSFSLPHSLLYVSPEEVNESLKENPVLIVVDDHKNQFYNQTEIRAAEGQSDASIFALSSDVYSEEAHKYCGVNSKHCVVFLNGNDRYTYDGEIDSNLILDFIDSKMPKDESL